MPKRRFELTEKQIEGLRTVGEVLLAVSIIAGTIALTVLAPNIFQVLDKMPWAKRTYRNRDTKSKDQQKKIAKSFYYIKQKGYVRLIPEGDDFKVKITRQGRKRMEKMRFNNLQIKKLNKWDSHWWLIIADVPSKDFRRQEDYFREKLKEMKFYPLQRTVWMFPFDPRDEIDFVSAYYHIDRFVTVMEVIRMDPEDEKNARAYFKDQQVLQW